MKKIVKIMSGLLVMMLFVAVPVKANAADAKLSIEKTAIDLAANDTALINVGYTGPFEDLDFVIADTNIIAASLTDFGSGKAIVAIAAKNIGTSGVIVYQKSKPENAVYVVTRCGLPTGDDVVTLSEATGKTTIYSDGIVKYQDVMHGKNDASMQIKEVELTKSAGMNELKVSADVLTDDSVMPGLACFYANFYDISGKFIKRQSAYVRTNLDRTMNIIWYIPENCVTISIE